MVRDEERKARATEDPIVDGLPEVPGILVAMRLSPGLSVHLKGLADELLVNDFPGATISRAERELIATAVSAANNCFYCMDSRGAFASELLAREQMSNVVERVDEVKKGGSAGRGAKLDALLALARAVQRDARTVTRADVDRARAAGASEGDTQLAVLIASAFCMYNRMVDGLRAKTPPSDEAYRLRAREIADHGYSDPRLVSVPR